MEFKEIGWLQFWVLLDIKDIAYFGFSLNLALVFRLNVLFKKIIRTVDISLKIERNLLLITIQN